MGLTKLKIGAYEFTLVAVWKESIDGSKTFEGYMLYPDNPANAPIAPKAKGKDK